MTPEAAISSTPDVSSSVVTSGSPDPAESSSAQATTGTSSADVQAQSPVQGTQETQLQTENDPLQGLPSEQDLDTVETVSKKAFLQVRGAYEQLKPQFEELNTRFSVFEPVADRFEKPEQLQSVLELSDSLLAWENDPQSGEPVPSTYQGAQKLSELYPQHADYLAADLLNMPTVDPETGRQAARIDFVLEEMSKDAEQRAKVLKIFNAVEPNAITPQWQATEAELAVVREDLRDIYKSLPYEDREELKLNSPEFINKTLANEKLTRDLKTEREQAQVQREQYQQQQAQQLNLRAQEAGNIYVSEQLSSALTTFHKSVVDQCNFIEPLDPASLPQGVTPEQATQMNAQIAASNKAEAAQITGLVVSLFNPETSQHVIPLLKEIGVIDDKFLQDLNNAASAFGNNARNYGNLTFRRQAKANGNGYQPEGDVIGMKNTADQRLKYLVHLANQVKTGLIERRSQFFSLKAQGHNATLNGAGTVRPQGNGTAFNPTTAPASASLPMGRLSRAEIDAQFG